MDGKMDELIRSINNLSNFSWGDIISLIALIASWITIFILIKDKLSESRPYLQVTFELVRSNLTCIVIRNVGKVPLTLKRIHFDEEFVKQLPDEEQRYLNDNKITNLNIFPGKEWIVCLGVIVPEILEKYNKKVLFVNYEYKKMNGMKTYRENSTINFEQYSRFLVYISEIDELKQVNEKIEKSAKNIDKKLNNIETSIVQYHNMQDAFIKTVVSGHGRSDKK